MKYYRITDIKSLVEFVNREAIRAAKRFDSPFEGDLDHIKSLILYSHPWAVTKISDKNPLILSENDVKVSLCLDTMLTERPPLAFRKCLTVNGQATFVIPSKT